MDYYGHMTHEQAGGDVWRRPRFYRGKEVGA